MNHAILTLCILLTLAGLCGLLFRAFRVLREALLPKLKHNNTAASLVAVTAAFLFLRLLFHGCPVPDGREVSEWLYHSRGILIPLLLNVFRCLTMLSLMAWLVKEVLTGGLWKGGRSWR